jgi:hypothetical protein
LQRRKTWDFSRVEIGHALSRVTGAAVKAGPEINFGATASPVALCYLRDEQRAKQPPFGGSAFANRKHHSLWGGIAGYFSRGHFW